MYLTNNQSHLIKISANSLKSTIGKHIVYLRSSDIDNTGRGYYFPKFAQVKSVKGKNIELENGDWIYFGDLKEIVLHDNYKPQN